MLSSKDGVQVVTLTSVNSTARATWKVMLSKKVDMSRKKGGEEEENQA